MNQYADDDCEFCGGTGEYVDDYGDPHTCQCAINNKKEKEAEDNFELERGN